jgi:membrane protein insertase Oxa1/YidC/SpoIIIJ
MKDTLASFGTIVLMLFGIGGFSYHLFKDDGWLEAAVGNLWDVTVSYPLIALPVIIAAVFFFKTWNESRAAHGTTSKLPNFVIYIMMGAGVVFLFRFFTYGNF